MSASTSASFMRLFSMCLLACLLVLTATTATTPPEELTATTDSGIDEPQLRGTQRCYSLYERCRRTNDCCSNNCVDGECWPRGELAPRGHSCRHGNDCKTGYCHKRHHYDKKGVCRPRCRKGYAGPKCEYLYGAIKIDLGRTKRGDFSHVDRYTKADLYVKAKAWYLDGRHKQASDTDTIVKKTRVIREDDTPDFSHEDLYFAPRAYTKVRLVLKDKDRKTEDDRIDAHVIDLHRSDKHDDDHFPEGRCDLGYEGHVGGRVRCYYTFVPFMWRGDY